MFEHTAIRTVSVHGPNATMRSAAFSERSPSALYIAATPPIDGQSGNPLGRPLLDSDDEKASGRRHRVIECHDDSDAVEVEVDGGSWSMSSRRQHIEAEMVSTERTFCRGLDALINELLLPMFDRKLIDHRYYRQCMSSLPKMLEFHRALRDKLEAAALDDRSVAATLCRTVGRQRDHFTSIYLKFIAEYNAVLQLFGTTFHQNKRLNQFLRAKRKEKKPLSNLLILPIQRVPRYILLLRELRKNTPMTHSDFQHIERALGTVTSIAVAIDEEQGRIDDLSQCLQIQKLLIGLKRPLVDEDGRRRFEGQFVVIKKDGKRQRLLLLFSDTLIVTNCRYAVKQQLSVRTVELKLHGLDDGAPRPEFTIISREMQQIRYVARSRSEMQRIHRLIKRCRAVMWDHDLAALDAPTQSLRDQLCRQQPALYD